MERDVEDRVVAMEAVVASSKEGGVQGRRSGRPVGRWQWAPVAPPSPTGAPTLPFPGSLRANGLDFPRHRTSPPPPCGPHGPGLVLYPHTPPSPPLLPRPRRPPGRSSNMPGPAQPLPSGCPQPIPELLPEGQAQPQRVPGPGGLCSPAVSGAPPSPGGTLSPPALGAADPGLGALCDCDQAPPTRWTPAAASGAPSAAPRPAPSCPCRVTFVLQRGVAAGPPQVVLHILRLAGDLAG